MSHIPGHSVIAMWIAAGQDGQQTLWLTLNDGKITWQEEPQLRDMIPPAFNDSGSEFLVASDDEIYRYSYPDMQLLGTYQCLDEGI
jgi:hypothetical protein